MQKVIGITGGTGCGKTTALQVLQTMGVHIIDCDALYHDLLQTNTAMLHAIAEAFPGAVEGGILNRKKLGALVFENSSFLDKLNDTVWPFVVAAVKAVLEEQAPQSCAIDAIGLFESGLYHLCTHTVAVTAPEETRVKRIMARDGISREYALLRLGAQQPNAYFAARCGMVLENPYDDPAAFARKAKTAFLSILKEETS